MPFQINVTASITPANTKNEIEAAFDGVYKGERGDNETTAEFLERKLEEHVLAIYSSQKSNTAASAASAAIVADLRGNAQIKQKKVKPAQE